MFEYLEIEIPSREYFDEVQERFAKVKGRKIRLMHSLVSVSKWEAKWHKPFLDRKEKTYEEWLDYVRCMTVTSDVDPELYYFIPQSEIEKINKYLEDPMTATWFSNKQRNGRKGSSEVVTSEIIYWQMIQSEIPIDPCEKWPLNRLLTLIRVCNEKNAPGQKMSNKDILRQNRALNAARRAKSGSRG